MTGREDRLRLRDNDTLPPSRHRDERLVYYGFHSWAFCRFRLYYGPDGMPFIVLTELPENKGTSITNAAERAHYLAWERIGKPWPCRFFEHYPGRKPWGTGIPKLDAEHVDEVFFMGTSGDGLAVTVVVPIRLDQEQEPLTLDECPKEFIDPNWKPIPLAEFKQLIEAGQ